MKNKNQGITLIALIITVIVLLILAGVTIGMLTGKDGMLAKINQAKEESEQAHIKEEVELAIQEFYMEKAQQGKLGEVNLKNLSEYLSKKLENVVIKELTSEKIASVETTQVVNEKLIIEYKGYEIEINNKYNVRILGKVGLRVEYSFEPEGYTKDSAVMTFNISTPSGVSLTSITALTEGTEVVEANSKFKFTANGTYEFKIVTSDNNTKEVKVLVDKFDTDAPNANIELTLPYSFINGTLKAKVILTDEKSGVSLENSKWIINTSNAALGTEASKYTGGTFTSEEQEISSAKLTATGSYFFHVLATDKFGNAKEYISDVATIKSGYAISTPQDLQNIKNNLTASYYVVNDIDMKDFTFTPINAWFKGVLDGQGYTISNLTYTATSGYAGLFGYMENATVQNIIFENVNLSTVDGSYSSAIAGTCKNSKLIKVGVTGKLKGGYETGSLVCIPSGMVTITNCYARTNLTSLDKIAGTAAKWHRTGGLIGGAGLTSNNWKITNSYWSGTTNSVQNFGALVSTGYDFANYTKSSITNSFYNTTLCTVDETEICDLSAVNGLPTDQFAVESNFTSKGWDFTNTWYIGESGYPELKFQKTN